MYLRYHAGIVTDEMLSLPKAPFLAVGLLEALGAATGMAAGGNAHFIMLLFASWDSIYGNSWLLNSKCFALYDLIVLLSFHQTFWLLEN